MKTVSHDAAAPQPPTATAAVARSSPARPASAPELLADVVRRAGLWDLLAERTPAGDPADVRVLLTPQTSGYRDATTAVDSALLECLIDMLHARGYRHVAVGAAGHCPGVWSGRPDPTDAQDACRRLGYSGLTPQGNAYPIVDLSEDLAPADFPLTGVLHGSSMARAWLDAEFRINIAKNLTHPEFGYALCLANLFGVLPHPDRHHHYRARRDGAEVITELLRRYPPDFHLIDAVVSSHGLAGAHTPLPIRTDTVIASPDAVLADVVGAILMGVDPALSPLMAGALAEIGLPPAYHVDGDLTPYPQWRNPPPVALDAMRRLSSDGRLHRLLAASAAADPDAVRDDDPLLAKVSTGLTALARNADGNPLALGALVGLLGTAGAGESLVRAWRAGYAKHAVHRRDVSLGLDLENYTDHDYDALDGYLEPMERLIDAIPADFLDMRWRHLDGSVLFGCDRCVNAPFEAFTARVDISRSISYMTDYLGGRIEVVSRDTEGRPVRQAERNLYLQQPNYMAFYGGEPIDVCKLESIRRTPDMQRIAWRTVRSPNGSAEYDDGSVTFRAADGGRRTRITIRVRQRFTLPLVWQAIRPDNWPQLRDPLTQDAYRRFFTRTLDNFEARYEGREYRIGRLEETADDGAEELPTRRLTDMVHTARALAGQALTTVRAPDHIDADGFQHFTPGRTAARTEFLQEIRESLRPAFTGFRKGLREAVARDMRDGERP
ncbi:DUF362 domain-containing protein [Streptomyces sp. NPDC093707]|uniref:DUF362 domain-containing protein n=1 Tax=Streptomyces sp. NPDC093707 TaxID=3154984 RepID=UPI00344F010D